MQPRRPIWQPLSQEHALESARKKYVTLEKPEKDPEIIAEEIRDSLAYTGLDLSALDPSGQKSSAVMDAEYNKSLAKGRVYWAQTISDRIKNADIPFLEGENIIRRSVNRALGSNALNEEDKQNAKTMLAAMEPMKKEYPLYAARKEMRALREGKKYPDDALRDMNDHLREGKFTIADLDRTKTEEAIRQEMNTLSKAGYIRYASNTLQWVKEDIISPEDAERRAAAHLKKAGTDWNALGDAGTEASRSQAAKAYYVRAAQKAYDELYHNRANPDIVLDYINSNLKKAGATALALKVEIPGDSLMASEDENIASINKHIHGLVELRHINIAHQCWNAMNNGEMDPKKATAEIHLRLNKAGVNISELANEEMLKKYDSPEALRVAMEQELHDSARIQYARLSRGILQEIYAGKVIPKEAMETVRTYINEGKITDLSTIDPTGNRTHAEMEKELERLEKLTKKIPQIDQDAQLGKATNTPMQRALAQFHAGAHSGETDTKAALPSRYKPAAIKLG